jgi:hypothetical protein
MAKALRAFLIAVVAFSVVLAGLAVAEITRRRAQVRGACERAQALIDRGATRTEAIRELGPPWGDRGAEDLPTLERLFASPPQEAETLKRHLTGANRVLIYSTNDYIMFVLVDGKDRATEAECFHQ